MTDRQTILESVKSRYSAIAKAGAPPCCGSDRELSDSSCCGPDRESAMGLTDISVGYNPSDLASVPKGASMGLGCGNPTSVADLKPGEVVVDLGSGGGVDCFLAAQKVGERGFVIGVDMTDAMIDKARQNATIGGYKNVDFRLGEIEALPVESATVDIVISNCVINLAPDKSRVFGEMYRVLKPGGRFSVSDIVIKGTMPQQLRENMERWAGCITGALEKNQYLRTVKNAGFERIEVRSEVDYDYQKTPEFSITSVTVVGYKPTNGNR